MDFFDFEIRAWRTGKTHIQVIVHSSPAGDLEKRHRRLRLLQTYNAG